MTDQAPTPAPKHRWLRFSLRGLLVLMTLFGCWQGYVQYKARQRQAEYLQIRREIETGTLDEDVIRAALREEWPQYLNFIRESQKHRSAPH